METITEFTDKIVNEINAKRKESKNKWYTYFNNTKYQERHIDIKIKGVNTWIQVLCINGIKHNSMCDISVSEFKHNIEEAIEYHL